MRHYAESIRAIVFDFGGVLMDWNPRHLYRKLFPSNEGAMERFLVEIGFTEWNLQQDSGRAFSVAVAELVEQFPAYTDLIRAYDERWEESIAGPIQATVATLLPLRQAGYELHGLSNWSSEKFAVTRTKYEFFDLFETILVSGDVKLVKPDLRIYTLFLERIGRAARECLFIDDSYQNIVAARRMGFETIHFESSDQLRMELQQRGLLPIE
jgi:2-haloacid dehalogenase